MKKAASLIFLLLADIIILAHAFVPHCEYNKMLIPLSMAVHHADNDNHCCSSQTNHHSSDEEDDCLLTRTYLKIEENEKEITSVDCILNCHLFSIIYINSLITTANSEFLSFKYKPYLSHHYCVFVATFIGLRAPPVC
ncbi:MAG: hypothetical protein LBT56_08420 [Prevotellaceae bacterium]|jgi:hypothetical protein|nr:hypothetical protein [Prevotellaceae bacterium]